MGAKIILVDRIGETKTMNNGLNATIISYRRSSDIDVQFENGEISLSKTYQQFQKRMIKCPMLFEYIDDYVKVTNPNVMPNISFLIDSDDVTLLGDCFWHVGNRGYAQARIDGKMQLLHRRIMQTPAEVEVDHRNGKKLDCRRFNLRFCSGSENSHNQPKQSHNTSGYKGVVWEKGKKKWRAQIGVNNKRVYLGAFTDIKEAARAYDIAAIKYHGAFARLNNV